MPRIFSSSWLMNYQVNGSIVIVKRSVEEWLACLVGMLEVGIPRFNYKKQPRYYDFV